MATPPVVTPPDQQHQQDGGLAALQRQLREQGEEVGRLREAVKNNKPKPPDPPAAAPQSKEAIETMFWKDPLPMVQAIASRAAFETEQRLQQNSLPTQIQVARSEVRKGDPEIFDLYAAEIDGAVERCDLQFRGNLNVWQNAFNIVKGQHTDEIVAAKIEKSKGSNVNTPPVNNNSGDGPAAPSVRQPPPPKEKPLSAEEMEVATGIGLTADEYKRGKNRYDNQDKEWSKVITFSSQQRRRDAAATKRKSA